jgi:NADPH:quinone reductase-like Zn-dependent oxidoreductase
MSEDKWNLALQEYGFSGLDLALWDTDCVEDHQASLMISTASQENSYPRDVVLVTDCTDEYLAELVAALAKTMTGLAIGSVVKSLAEASEDAEGKTFLFLNEIIDSLLYDVSQDEYNSIQKVILESQGILWVTRGGTIDAASPKHALVSGLLRTTRVETAGSTFVHLDLDAKNHLPVEGAADRIMDIFKASFDNRATEDATLEVEYAERSNSILIPRILNDDELNIFIAKETQQQVPEDQLYYTPDGRCLSVHVGSPGLLNSIYFTEDPPVTTELEDGCVKVQVRASGINFRDVMMAMGQMAMGTLGIECSGIVVETTPSVQRLKVGDRVATYQEFGTLGHFVYRPAEIVQKIPDTMSFAIAASLPVVYCTAYHALFNVARLCSGETILIHAASGGLGQATITLAQTLGAIIYATVGTIEKKRLLMSRFKIPEENIFTSRDHTFAKSVMRATNGRGVDVVINSVAGDLLRETFNCIAPLGRFLELGKRDFYINSRLEMQRFERNVTFASVDLVSLGKDAFHVVADAFEKVMTLAREGKILAPDPVTTFPMKDLDLALRTMQTGRHIGKLVIVPTPDDVVKVSFYSQSVWLLLYYCAKTEQVIPNRNNRLLFHKNASYLLVGGTGGLGRRTAEWMLQHGARNFIFASRRGAASKAASNLVKHLESLGATVAVFACDVSQETQLEMLISGTAERNMPQIRGVIQAAMVARVSRACL